MLISRYTDKERSGALDTWTGYEDIGHVFCGKTLTADEYYRVEDRYVDFVRDLFFRFSVEKLQVKALTIGEPLPSWLEFLRAGVMLSRETSLSLVRQMLRYGSPSCSLVGTGGLVLSVETDMYLSVEVAGELSVLEELVDKSGLRRDIEIVEPPDSVDGIIESRADSNFWESVRSATRESEVAVLVCWGNGRWGQQWHLVDDGSAEGLADVISPGMAVVAMLGARIEWCPRVMILDRIRERIGDNASVVVFNRPVAGTELSFELFLYGISVEDMESLPGGGELGWIEYPAGTEDGRALCVVQADSAGDLVCRWDSDLNLVW